jgi:hypothetical protein
MAGISDFFADQILNEKFRDTAATSLGSIHVALFSTLPNNDGTGGTELSAGNYARVSHATTNAAITAPAANGLARQVTLGLVDFGTASADWAPSGTEAVGFGIFDASTAGNYLGGALFATEKVIQSGDPVKFNAAELKIQITRPS